MLVTVIQAANYSNSIQQINKAIRSGTEAIELRLDYWQQLDFGDIEKIRRKYTLPMIFTLRKKSQGGRYPFKETQRLKDIAALCKLSPDYLDLEFDVRKNFIQRIKKNYPKIKIICSYHNFLKTPENLNAFLRKIINPHYDFYKIATTARSIIDTLRMLYFVKTNHKAHKLTGICMGNEGIVTRIVGPIIGNHFNYASLDKHSKTAPGQLDLTELLSIYHVAQLNSKSKIYTLLGDPIDKSVGHILHNRAIEILDANAVYVKLKVTPTQLPDAIKFCKQLPFDGFSVTMPLKECIVAELDTIAATAEKISVVNTIKIKNKKWIGFNTDGLGAIKALEQRVNLKNQKIVILGAGGSAKAIAYVALQKGARVCILNRTIAKAKKIAAELGCEAAGLDKIADLKIMQYTILINTLPITMQNSNQMQALIKPKNLLPNTIAMDIIYQPIETSFLKIAKRAKCICIPGYEMYIEQALLQLHTWFKITSKQKQIIKNKMLYFFKKEK